MTRVLVWPVNYRLAVFIGYYRGMKIAIVGFATEGKISAEYFARRGHDVTVCDQNEAIEVPEAYQKQLGETYLKDLDKFDVVVRTAGMSPHIILDENPSVAPKITTAVNEFLANCPTRHTIGITGTKGKGTTSTLVTKMLEAAGKKVWLGGNIGRSPLEFIDEISPEDWVVLELSSFQLIDVQHSPHIAVCLMVVPEHLNWHADMAEYIAAKSRLFMQQSSDDIAIYYADNETSKAIAGHGAGLKLPYFREPGAWVNGNMLTIDGQSVCATDAVRLLGAHNLQNICAAITVVWQAGLRDVSVVTSVVSSFSGLEHRLEFVRELDDVRYYDDSFGTTPETAIVAIEAFKEPKVVILGGSDKGASYDELARAVAVNNVRHALLIGDQADPIRAALERAGFQAHGDGGGTMTEIIAKAREVAKPGDVVLLSTGCASFGLFKDYKDRGNQFKTVVQGL
jgi:UDP-N-acetylmuramoylalanine--D-glutamate ligase